jgi:predicted RNA binding protein YcfA (HicA-like mRNA interferase family)
MSHRKDCIKTLENNGYVLVRSNGHFVYRNATGHTVIVPNHNKMNYFTFKSIMKKICK